MTDAIALAFIASAADTPPYSIVGDVDLAFAHLCDRDAVYRDYFAASSASGRTVILDNGIMELGGACPEDVLVSVARAIGPAYITPPEVLGDGKITLDLTCEFIAHATERGIPSSTRVLGVVHGADWDEWLDCYRRMHAIDDIVLLGIPYDITFDVPGVDGSRRASVHERMLHNRIAAVRALDALGLNRKPAHLLGCVDAIELRAHANLPWIVSNDSSTAYVTAQRGERYDPQTGIGARKHKIDMSSAMPAGGRDLFLHNVSTIRRFAQRPVCD